MKTKINVCLNGHKFQYEIEAEEKEEMIKDQLKTFYMFPTEKLDGLKRMGDSIFINNLKNDFKDVIF